MNKMIDDAVKKWDKSAILRMRPRRIIKEDSITSQIDFFPLERQPLCGHPAVTELGRGAIQYIQIQSLYMYLHGIAKIEIDVINNATNDIYNNTLPIKFSNDICIEALTVIIDESYHAFVALDIMNQLATITKIKPLEMTNVTEASYAIDVIKNQLPKDYISSFDFIAVCLSEQALTTDLIDVLKHDKMFSIFYDVMRDHVADEGRHAKFSQKVLGIFWQQITDDKKAVLAPTIPRFIALYHTTHIKKEFDHKILSALKLSEGLIDSVLFDNYTHFAKDIINCNDVVTKQMFSALEKAKITEDSYFKNALTHFKVIKESVI